MKAILNHNSPEILEKNELMKFVDFLFLNVWKG